MLVGLALAHDCPTVDLDTLLELPAPAVIVLGERHGERSDLERARKVVEGLQAAGPVVLAIEAVHEKNQAVLDRYALGEIKTRKLPAALDWSESWGFAWRPYKRLVTAGRRGVPVVASGLDLGPKPADRDVPMPEGYAERMMAAIAEHAHHMSPEVRERFPTSMAWRDLRIGELGAAGWNGEGYLVVLTGRGHVEGGQGTNWQLGRLVDAPVHSVLLAHEGAACHEGDRVLAD